MGHGRPTKYEEWMDKTIEDELSRGYSLRGASPTLGVVSSTVYKWVQDNTFPSFSDAVKRGLDKGLRFMENRLMQLASGTAKKTEDFDPSKVNVTILIFTMKARYNEIYGDRQRIDTTHSGSQGQPITIEYVQAPSRAIEPPVEILNESKEV